MLQKGDSVVVALSGGADSVSLLHCLYSIKEQYNLTLHACHVNHGIRGAEADRDEQFCKILCEKYHIPLHTKYFDVPQLAKKYKISEELCGREVRGSYYIELFCSLHAKIATAHTMSDNAETLLFNLTRGAALKGSSGIPATRGGYLIRPLIHCTREQVERYCAENALEYVTDSTNLTDDYTRNKIRHHVVPALKELNPRFEEAISRFCESQNLLKEYMDMRGGTLINKAQVNTQTNSALRADVLLGAHPAELLYALELFCNYPGHETKALPLETRHLSLLLNILQNGGAVDLGYGWTAVCKQGLLRMVKKEKPCKMYPIPLTESFAFLYHYKRVEVRIDSSKSELKDLVFRNRQPGDRFTFAKRSLTKPLRKALNEKKIPDEERDSLLLLCQGSTVLWCEGLGYSQQGEALVSSAGLTIEFKHRTPNKS